MGMKYDKLVRDNIPRIIEQDGEQPSYRTVTGPERTDYLHRKLDEEVSEFLQSPSVEEIADIREVLDAIEEQMGISKSELVRAKQEKAHQKGGFDRGIILEAIE